MFCIRSSFLKDGLFDRSKQRDFQLMSMQVQRTRGENALNVLEEYKEGQCGQGSVSEEENNK